MRGTLETKLKFGIYQTTFMLIVVLCVEVVMSQSPTAITTNVVSIIGNPSFEKVALQLTENQPPSNSDFSNVYPGGWYNVYGHKLGTPNVMFAFIAPDLEKFIATPKVGEQTVNCVANPSSYVGKTMRIQFMYFSNFTRNNDPGEVMLEFSLVFASPTPYTEDSIAAGPFTFYALQETPYVWLQFDQNVVIPDSVSSSTLMCVKITGNHNSYVDNIIIVEDNSTPNPLIGDGSFEHSRSSSDFGTMRELDIRPYAWYNIEVVKPSWSEIASNQEKTAKNVGTYEIFQCLESEKFMSIRVQINIYLKSGGYVNFYIYDYDVEVRQSSFQGQYTSYTLQKYVQFDKTITYLNSGPDLLRCFVFSSPGEFYIDNFIVSTVEEDKCKNMECPDTDNDACIDAICADGACTTKAHCDDGKSCTDDECLDSITGECTNTMNCEDRTLQCQSVTCETSSTTNPTGCVYVNTCTTDDKCKVAECDGNGNCNIRDKCSADNDLCTTDYCDVDGNCKHDAMICNDEKMCTDDECVSGNCEYTMNCEDRTLQCQTVTCEASTSSGSGSTIIPSSTTTTTTTTTTTPTGCVYVNTCTTDDNCKVAECDGNGNCNIRDKCESDNDLCTIDCVDGNCVYEKIICEDDNKTCTNDECVDGKCEYTLNCEDRSLDCYEAICDERGECDWSNTCTTDDKCKVAECDGKGNCNISDRCSRDDDLCTIDYCDAKNGECHHDPVDCSDESACTDDYCNGDTGKCYHVRHSCDDGNQCTVDTCNPLNHDTPCSYSPRNCNDSSACTDDTCDSKIGCVNKPISCDDKNQCTVDLCDPNAVLNTDRVNGCYHNVSTVCDDKNACTLDSCDSVLGCVHSKVNCSDNNVCTTDSCSTTLGCQYISTLTCNDNNLCTSDVCHPTKGCTFSQLTSPSVCAKSSCSSDSECVVSSNKCLVGKCSPITKKCVLTSLNCDDSNVCTNDTCSTSTGCVNTVIPNCNSGGTGIGFGRH